MPFENKTGLNVSNFYGPRDTGGTRGVVKTEGTYNEYSIMVPFTTGIDFKFPVLKGVKIVGFQAAYATGTLSALTIGGVNVFAASEAAPVNIPAGNTGVVVQTGLTAGELIIKFTRLTVG
jgi:hypothetical protein